MVVSVGDLFNNLQKQMHAKMMQVCPHGPTKGDITEEAWRCFFKDYLPKRYSCDKAIIIDNTGNVSQQIDVVIYDEHFSPFILNQDGIKYIPAESVYAVFEVKQSLSKENFEDAQKKALSVRRLIRTTAPVLCNGVVRLGREPANIIAGLLTTTRAWEETLTNQEIVIDDSFLDVGCCVNGKSWIFQGDKYILSHNEKDSLLTFFMALLEKLQQFGTVPAMEIPKYFDGFASADKGYMAQTDFDPFEVA